MAGVGDIQVGGIRAGRGGGDQVQQRDVIQLRTVTDGWEGGRMEEGNMEISR